MSQLIKPLQRRIQEIAKSIAARESELAAYRHLLHIESSRRESTAVAPLVVEEPAKANGDASPQKKRRISPEGLKRIKAALKRRWAAKRASDSASAS